MFKNKSHDCCSKCSELVRCMAGTLSSSFARCKKCQKIYPAKSMYGSPSPFEDPSKPSPVVIQRGDPVIIPRECPRQFRAKYKMLKGFECLNCLRNRGG